LNKRFGYRLKNGLPLGWVAYILLPSQAEVTGNTVRHLPAPVGKNNRFLDIGCGNGDFLKVARSLGYQAEGLEFDPSAREVAAKEGLVVHPNSMPGSGLPSNDYDQITLSHVVEHFHYPVEALTEVFNLLRPKGRVWIQIPNIAAFSLQRFGANSRLLEPPRHLVMLDSQSLKILLEKAGFKNVQLLPTPDSSNFNYVCYASWMIEEGIDPGKTSLSLIPKDVRLATDAMRCSHERTAENAEFVTMIGTKP
jgi:SAM-dependent methyltransferase